jgi:RNA polymerase sigma-70 factor (ECF subfamily)
MNTEDRKQILTNDLTEAYDAHSDAIFRLCLYKTSSHDVAKDLVQEVFLRYWDYMLQDKTIDNSKAFLFHITRNLIIDYYRKKKQVSLDSLQEQGFDPHDQSHASIVNNAELRIAKESIESLDDTYRDVVYMRLVEEMSMEEIGKSLGLSANAATVRYHRGMKQLEKCFAEKDQRMQK